MLHKVRLQIVTVVGQPLPESLQNLKHADLLSIQGIGYYTIHNYELPYLGDEHLLPLDDAFKAGEIAHWAGPDTSASSFNTTL